MWGSGGFFNNDIQQDKFHYSWDRRLSTKSLNNDRASFDRGSVPSSYNRTDIMRVKRIEDQSIVVKALRWFLVLILNDVDLIVRYGTKTIYS